METRSEKAWFWIIQFTWGIIQTLIGLAVLLYLIATQNPCEWRWHRCAMAVNVVNGSRSGSVATLGPFILYFMGYTDSVVWHEYGHCLQSLILGPLWIFVIGIPSWIWCARHGGESEYYDFYTEKWASELGDWAKAKAEREAEGDDETHGDQE